MVCLSTAVATVYDVEHRETGESRNSVWGGKRTRRGRFVSRPCSSCLPPPHPLRLTGRFDLFFIKAVTRAEKVWRSKKTRHDLVNFDLFLYSVQSQLSSTPPAGESSYTTNVSGGHASIGDHSVTIVETTTPR